MMDCPETPVTLRVNGDLAVKVRVLKADLNRCNADKAALRSWAKDTAK